MAYINAETQKLMIYNGTYIHKEEYTHTHTHTHTHHATSQEGRKGLDHEYKEILGAES